MRGPLPQGGSLQQQQQQQHNRPCLQQPLRTACMRVSSSRQITISARASSCRQQQQLQPACTMPLQCRTARLVTQLPRALLLPGCRSRPALRCRSASTPQQQPDDSSSGGSAEPAPAAAQDDAVSKLTVEAVQADPDATIEAINKLTRQQQQDGQQEAQRQQQAPAAAAAAGGSAGANSTKTNQQQQAARGGLDALVAAAAAAWANAQHHWAGLLGVLAAAVAAVRASLGKFPAWVAAQKLQRLGEAADGAPQDGAKQAAYLAALNEQSHPREVLARVESKAYASNPSVVVEYLKALVATERLNEYADSSSSSSGNASSSGSNAAATAAAGAGSGGAGVQLAPGQDHRSLITLLRELQGLAAGGGSSSGSGSSSGNARLLGEEPGSSLRRPLHVVVQGAGVGGRAGRPAGPLQALWGLLGSLTLICGLSAAWLVGSQVMRSAGLAAAVGGQQHGGASLAAGSGSSAAAGGAGALGGGSGASNAGPAVEPKEYKRDELPEASVKSFADVLGCDESKAELQEVVEFLRDPARFTRLGAKLPRGVLLTGPPGTGKTLLAKAVAGEAGVPFFYRAGSEFEELYVGVGSRRMRALFGAAKKKAPCIVFIDEIDAIGGNRKHWENHTRKTLNQLLVEMDGFEANEGVIVMAATNLPETLDPALKRPGRFDRQVAVPLPDVAGRAEILSHYLRDKPVTPGGIDTTLLARQTAGFSGADLANLVNEAALSAAKAGADAITLAMIDSAYDKVLMGVERKSAVRSPESLKRTAYHEGGHALVAASVPGASPLHKATIVPRGHALGMVTQVGREDEFSISRQQMLARILVSMGGTVAEELVFGKDQVSSGATDDLRQATSLARHMVMQCGLSEAVGPLYVDDGDFKGLSEGLRQQIDQEVRSLLVSARAQVKSLLSSKLEQLHGLAGALLEHETLNSVQIKAVLAGEKLAPALQKLQQQAAGAAAAAAADGADAADVAAAAAAAALDDQ